MNILNPVSFPKTKISSSIPRITFAKNGAISFNRKAEVMLNLKAGDCVSFCNDPKEPENWYVFVSKDGFKIMQFARQILIFRHMALKSKLMDAFGLSNTVTQKIILAGKPTILDDDKNIYYGLLNRVNL